MSIRTPADLGAAIRERRKELKLDQAELAARIGVSRQWVISVEKGRSRTEIGLLLQALETLGLRLETFQPNPRPMRTSGPDIDAIVTKAKKGTR